MKPIVPFAINYFPSKPFAFDLCSIEALIPHNPGKNFTIIPQILVWGRENTADPVPPRGFIQSIQKINNNHTIHLALLLGWQKGF